MTEKSKRAVTLKLTEIGELYDDCRRSKEALINAVK